MWRKVKLFLLVDLMFGVGTLFGAYAQTQMPYFETTTEAMIDGLYWLVDLTGTP